MEQSLAAINLGASGTPDDESDKCISRCNGSKETRVNHLIDITKCSVPNEQKTSDAVGRDNREFLELFVALLLIE